VSTAETGTRGSRPGDLHRRRVVLVAESAGLAAVLNHLLDPADRLSRLGSPRELAESRSLDSADVVVLDVPAGERAAAVAQIRRRHLGPLVILVTKGEASRGLHLDDACALLTRPFSTGELGAALAVPGRPVDAPTADGGPRVPSFSSTGGGSPIGVALAAPPGADTLGETPDPPAGPGTAAADHKASARQAPFRPPPAAPPGPGGPVERVQRLLAALTQSWQARRRVRVAGFSVFALVAFTAAFAVAAQGGRCGPGCDAFGTVFSPAPTVAPSSSRAPSTTGPKRSTTTAPSGSPGTGGFRGISGSRLGTTSTTERRVTATTRPATTRPPATTHPPTTAPPTTAPPTTAPPTTAPPTTAPPTTAGA
jgi:hypothetical protein